MDFVDTKYISILSSRLLKFKKVKNNLYNFRCPICGDSQKNKNRARGYFYQVKNNSNFKCHNCGVNISFNNFLKTFDVDLHRQYVFEKFKEGNAGRNFQVEEPKFNFQKPDFFTKTENSQNLKKIDLPKASENQKAREYLESRKLNPYKFYYTNKFKEWTNSKIQTFNENSLRYEEERIIIPLIYQNELVGFQGRSLGSSSVKYITIMLDEDAPKIYGLDEIKKEETVYITEGPFDSTFICNSIAMCGADGDLDKWGISDRVWVYDNEPRNKDITARISKCIDRGERVVIWNSSIKEKDINEMILSGLDVKYVIESNTYQGLEAKLKFNTWKKI